mmetsp:Transcript_2207/g.4061  ORF Transcript_2207/g.4061 Transcript_2207/m.4061 type:complete len:238 (-) Transcript_2207:355-1068(-)
MSGTHYMLLLCWCNDILIIRLRLRVLVWSNSTGSCSCGGVNHCWNTTCTSLLFMLVTGGGGRRIVVIRRRRGRCCCSCWVRRISVRTTTTTGRNSTIGMNHMTMILKRRRRRIGRHCCHCHCSCMVLVLVILLFIIVLVACCYCSRPRTIVATLCSSCCCCGGEGRDSIDQYKKGITETIRSSCSPSSRLVVMVILVGRISVDAASAGWYLLLPPRLTDNKNKDTAVAWCSFLFFLY